MNTILFTKVKFSFLSLLQNTHSELLFPKLDLLYHTNTQYYEMNLKTHRESRNGDKILSN